MKKCFIVCPIGNDGSDTRKRSDTLLNYVLKPICTECGFEAVRVDELNTGNSITQNIIELLDCSDLVIVDLTELNPNVFFELGYRTALRKPTIQIKSKGEPLPFDINTIQTFDYDISDIPDTENFKTRIKQTIQSYDFDSININSNSKEPKNNFNSVILQEIYKMQDILNYIMQKLNNNNVEAVSVLADKLTQAHTKTPEAALIETVLPELLKNPDAFAKIAELSKKSN